MRTVLRNIPDNFHLCREENGWLFLIGDLLDFHDYVLHLSLVDSATKFKTLQTL